MRPIFTSTTTINNLYVYVKVRVSDILGPTSTSSIITHTITYYSVTKKIINTTRIIRYMKQYTIINWVMEGRVAGIVPIYGNYRVITLFSLC